MSSAAVLKEQVQTLKTANARLEANNSRLEANNSLLEENNSRLESEKARLEEELKRVKEELRLALARKYAKSSEKIPEQSELPFEESSAPQEAPPEDEAVQTVAEHTRKAPGRKPLDPNLPRVDRVFELSQEQRRCACGCQMDEIGEEVTERLNMIPEQMFVERHRRKKYACPHCQGLSDENAGAVKIAPGEPSLQPGSILTPGLLAFILTQKFCDHLPYYRQEQRFGRIGVHLPRQDLVNWQAVFTRKLAPLITRLEDIIRAGPVIQMDETPVTLLKMEGRKNGSQGYMWLAKGGPPEHQVVRYRFAAGRGAIHAQSFLQDYQGYLQTDGYEAYTTATKGTGISHVGCWAHARRKFFEADKVGSSVFTKEALKRIAALYQSENDLRAQKLPADEFARQRRELLEPKMAAFFEWLTLMRDRIAPASAFGKAMRYTLGQREKLEKVLDLPDLALDNNGAENAIRPFVLGRKNWLFSGNEEGAESSCQIFTLIETAKLNGLNPYTYLYRLAETLPRQQAPLDWDSLLPWNLPQAPIDPKEYLRFF